ncbi:DUF4956 domain-containing protein [Collinsella tanakaei]|nr:DUF4956 domain-containing protein [Collinsella tanakaei]MBM6784905.1 DUF4956 domain-containing protein [Collinsella tanakaei]
MRQELYQLLQGSGSVIGFEDAAIRVLVAAALGLVIFFSYWISHAGTIYSQKFNVTLVTLTVLTATVMMVIGSSIALSLGMVGALSIVRFRTAIKDARDTTYIFWAIICGICCGVAQFLAAAVGSAIVFVILLLLGRIRNDVRTLIMIRAARIRELELEGRMYEVLGAKASLRVKNTTEESVELIYEINKSALDKAERAAGTSLTDKLYAIENVEYVNIVSQNDEIGS